MRPAGLLHLLLSAVALLPAACLAPPPASGQAGVARPTPPAELPAGAQLPEGTQHPFAPPRPEWVARVAKLRLRPDAFVVVGSDDPGDPADLYTESRYYEPGSPAVQGVATPPTYGVRDETGLRKLVRRRPDGLVDLEQDWLGEVAFERRFYPDGSFASFLHWRKSTDVVAGYSVSPDGRTKSSLAGGEGRLTIWQSPSGDSTTRSYHAGRLFLVRDADGAGQDEGGTACVGNDSLVWSREGERLTLSARGEIWTKRRGLPATASPVTGGVTVPSDVIHQRVEDVESTYHANRPSTEATMREKEQAIADAYAIRRTEFLAAFGEVLTRAGRPWDDLGATFSRNSPP